MNYPELQSEIASWLNRSDLTSSIPTFIKMAQWDIEHGVPIGGILVPNRGLWKCMKVLTQDGSITAGDRTIPYPTRYKETEFLSIYYDVTGLGEDYLGEDYLGGGYPSLYPLKKQSLDYVLRSNINNITGVTLEGCPKHFACDDESSRFILTPIPDVDSTFVHSYWAYHAELSHIILGANKTTNGTFTGNATGWTLGTGWAYGTNNVTHTAGNVATMTQNTSEVAGVIYMVIFTISGRTAGTVTMSIGGVSAPSHDTNEIITEYVTTSTTGDLTFTPTIDFDGSLDSISVFLATGGTNWWTENAWQVLFFGALCKAEAFLINDPRLTLWKSEFKNALDGLAVEEINEAFSGHQSVGADLVVV